MTTETQATTGTTPTDPGTQQAAAAPATQDTTVLTAGAPATEQQAQTMQEGATQAGDKPAVEAKPDGEQSKGEGVKPKTDDKQAGAPEQYEDFAAPEGVQLDAELVGDLKTVAKELNLSQKDAQRVADLGPKLVQKLQGKQAEAFAQIRQTWADQAKADKEYGGEAFAENLGAAKKALDSFGTPELRTLLNESGIGNHPELIRFMVRAGKAISSDTFVAGEKRGASASKDPAKTLYPNQA
ncbi:protease [Achromobacter xylosoxidans]